VLPPPPVPFTRAGIEAAELLKDYHPHTFVCFCDLGTSVAVMAIFITFLYLTISVVDLLSNFLGSNLRESSKAGPIKEK
jgi:hypothetical protein